MQPRARPTGVTILAILSTIGGIFSLILAGLSLLFGLVLGFVLLVGIGLVSFALAIGYLDGAGWAWTLGIILEVISILGSVVEILLGLPISVLGIVFSAVIILYITRPSVRAFFRRGALMSPCKSVKSRCLTYGIWPDILEVLHG